MLWYDFNKIGLHSRGFTKRWSNDSSFRRSRLKMLWKSEGCHPQQESFLHSGIQKARETNTLAANTLREARSRRSLLRQLVVVSQSHGKIRLRTKFSGFMPMLHNLSPNSLKQAPKDQMFTISFTLRMPMASPVISLNNASTTPYRLQHHSS